MQSRKQYSQNKTALNKSTRSYYDNNNNYNNNLYNTNSIKKLREMMIDDGDNNIIINSLICGGIAPHQISGQLGHGSASSGFINADLYSDISNNDISIHDV